MLRTGRISSNERQIDSGFNSRREIAFSTFSYLFQSLQCQSILSQIDSRIGEKLTCHPTHDALIEVFAAQESISRGGKYFEHAVVHFQNRDIESATTKIVDSDSFCIWFAQTECHSRCGGV